jgi:hypothetical protein
MTKCWVLLAAGVILLRTPAGRAEENGAPPAAGDFAAKGGLLGALQRCCAICEPKPCQPVNHFDLSQTKLGQHCAAAQDRAATGIQTWWHTPACSPFCLSQTQLGQRCAAANDRRACELRNWWNEPGRPPWTVAGSRCLGHVYDWVTYRSTPVPSCSCKACTPCCQPQLYTFWLCGGLGNGCGGGCAGGCAPAPAH